VTEPAHSRAAGSVLTAAMSLIAKSAITPTDVVWTGSRNSPRPGCRLQDLFSWVGGGILGFSVIAPVWSPPAAQKAMRSGRASRI